MSVKGERPLPPELQSFLRMEIPYGHFECRIELPPIPFQHLADGCLMLRLEKGSWR